MQSVMLRGEKYIITWQVSGSAEKDGEFVKVFQTEDESSMACGCKKAILFWYIFARVPYVEIRRWLLLLYVRSSYKENTDIFLCVRWSK